MVKSEPELRRGRLSSEFAAQKIDAFLVTAAPNVRYVSGFTGSNGAVLLMADGAILFTDPRYQVQASTETSCAIKIAKDALLGEVAKTILRKGLKRIGFERNRVSYDAHTYLKENLPLGVSLKPLVSVIEQLRMIKSAEEIELIRRSVATNSEAFARTMKSVRPGVSEFALAAELDFQMRRLGAQKPAFDTIVASGPRSALPHAQPTANRIANDQLLLVDMGASQDGYASDMTRTVYCGQPTPKVKQMYNAVLEAQLAAIAAIREGVTTHHVDSQARKVLKGKKLDQAFVHSTGHGLGLEIHEAPRLGKHDKGVLQAGMVVTVEPGVYIEGFGGIRIEDTVLVTETGCQVLTPTPKELLAL